MFVCWTKLRLFWPSENSVLESFVLKEHYKVNIINMEWKHQLRIADHFCLPAPQTCAILSCALQERRELWDRTICMHAGKATKENGGNTSSCVYHSNRDCFSHVTRDTKPPKAPHDQHRLVD